MCRGSLKKANPCDEGRALGAGGHLGTFQKATDFQEGSEKEGQSPQVSQKAEVTDCWVDPR